jgi:DNA-binding transcriptional ArsR family regulator
VSPIPIRKPNIHLPAQVRALVAPARQEIVDVLEAAGPCSVSRLAELCGRPADSLYHHLRRLARVGLVVETERRKEGRHVYAVYDLSVRPLWVSYSGPGRSKDVARVVGAAQRLSWRDFQKGLAAGDAAVEGARRTLWGARVKGWLTQKDLARVNQLLAELLRTVRSGRPVADRIPVSLSFLLAPSPPGARAAGPRSTERRNSKRVAPLKKGERP